MITIKLAEYERLCDNEKLLDALRAGGVDNWEGWDDAVARYQESDSD